SAAPELLFRGAALVVFARELIDGRILHDVLAGQLPGLLHDPRQRAVLTRRLVLDLLQHFLGEVETLLALVAAGHGASAVSGLKSARLSYGSYTRSVKAETGYFISTNFWGPIWANRRRAYLFGCGVIRKYGRSARQPLGKRALASSSDSDGTMTQSSPFFQ